jgi:putative PIN family toxin of toxin-antitoxin system
MTSVVPQISQRRERLRVRYRRDTPLPITTPTRVVFDTNVLLSLFAFAGERFAALRAAVDDGRVVCVTRRDCFEEFRRIVASSVLELTDEARAEALARYEARALMFDGAPRDVVLPRCADPDDQKFLELARDAGASWVVTLDRALLGLASQMLNAADVRVVVPRRLVEALALRGP